jgi:DNA-binding response OmpR family regulator
MSANHNQFGYVVIADENVDDYEPLLVDLSLRGMRVGLFSTSEQALRAERARTAILWIVNVKLPDMTGVALLTVLRQRLPRLAIFLVGNQYSRDDELAARTAGATAYVCKPLSVAWFDVCRPQHLPTIARLTATPRGPAAATHPP